MFIYIIIPIFKTIELKSRNFCPLTDLKAKKLIFLIKCMCNRIFASADIRNLEKITRKNLIVFFGICCTFPVSRKKNPLNYAKSKQSWKFIPRNSIFRTKILVIWGRSQITTTYFEHIFGRLPPLDNFLIENLPNF